MISPNKDIGSDLNMVFLYPIGSLTQQFLFFVGIGPHIDTFAMGDIIGQQGGLEVEAPDIIYHLRRTKLSTLKTNSKI